jgi:hypothetical protein
LAYTELLADEKATTAACFPILDAGWFERHGVIISLVMTDNDSGYRLHLFLASCHSLVAKPCTMRTNGMAERLIQTSLREWAYKQA